MRVLDLFAGLEGWSAPFRDRGHEVCSSDIAERFDVDIHADILDLTPADLPWRPDIVLASPPCEVFSVLQIGRNWTGPTDFPPHQPKTEKAELALRLVERTRWLIGELEPAFFVIENPRAKLRKLPPVADLERRTVTYCQYGEPFMKPTDLWGGFPPSLVLKPTCRAGDPCHVASPRGSTTGIQGDGVRKVECPRCGERVLATLEVCTNCGWVLPSPPREPGNRLGDLTGNKRLHREMAGTSDQKTLAALRAVIPYELSLAVCEAAERDLDVATAIGQGTLWT